MRKTLKCVILATYILCAFVVIFPLDMAHKFLVKPLRRRFS